MGALVINKTSAKKKKKINIDADELVLRLKTLADECNMEIVRLAIQSMLDEIEEAKESG